MSIERRFRSERVNSLSRLSAGRHATVIEMPTNAELQGCLMGMGLFVGTRFQLLRNGGVTRKTPFLLAVGETRIAIGCEIAETILVEE